MMSANEETEESVYSGIDCDNAVLPPNKRGKKLNYAMIKTFESKELALEEFSKGAMSRRRFRWSDKKDSDAREVLNFKCIVKGCFFFVS
jgi:hypothetical protein